MSTYNKASERHLPADERRGCHPAVREAEQILATNWKLAHRRQKGTKLLQCLVLLYGVTLWSITNVIVAITVVPWHPVIGVLSVLAMSGIGLALLATWRAWWRRSWHVEPFPCQEAEARISRGGAA
jgi:hypothetical protein